MKEAHLYFPIVLLMNRSKNCDYVIIRMLSNLEFFGTHHILTKRRLIHHLLEIGLSSYSIYNRYTYHRGKIVINVRSIVIFVKKMIRIPQTL